MHTHILKVTFYLRDTMLAVIVSVRLSLGHKSGVLLRLLNLGSCKQRHSKGVTSNGGENTGGVGSNWRLSTNISLYLRNSAR